MIFYITAVANGFLNTVNKMVNVKAGECLGAANGALINYVEATIISLCLIFVTGNGAEMNFSHTLKQTVNLFDYYLQSAQIRLLLILMDYYLSSY